MSEPDQTPSPLLPDPLINKKKGMSTGCIIGLVLGIIIAVVGGIALLASLAVVSGQTVLANARSLQTRAAMKGLELAVKGYQTEYNKLPETGGTDETMFEESKGPLLDILMAKDTEKNPRQIQFYAPPSPSPDGKRGGIINTDGKLEVRDSFGTLCRIHFDWNSDGKIPDPEHPGSIIAEPVIIYSAGPDLDYSTWKDNVTSWKP
jgi:hypothetical protein